MKRRIREKSQDDLVRVTVSLPDELSAKLASVSALQNTFMSHIVQFALENLFLKKECWQSRSLNLDLAFDDKSI